MNTQDNPHVRVLVVEDEPVLRVTFATFLEQDGHRVSAAESYDEAIRAMQLDEPDVVVTDILLQSRSGIELLQWLRQRGSDVEVIVITGEPNVTTAAEAVRLGAFDYLSKPVTGEALQRVVRLAAGRRILAAERDAYAERMDRYRRELEAVLHGVNEGIVRVDAAERIRQINAPAARMLGLNTVSEGPQPCMEVLPEPLRPACNAVRHTLKTGEAVPEFRLEMNHPENGDRLLVLSTTPLKDDAGNDRGALLISRDITDISLLERKLEGRGPRTMIGRSPRMRQLKNLIDDVAATDSTVLICGESGSGKELVAEALHFKNARANGPFVRVNCSALSEDILESELFGHVKGAFTGAIRNRAGRFETAHGGTILLDEIGDISPRLQLRLLRVLQEREFERVGDVHPIKVDVRVVASTHQDLPAKIRQGAFREDLYYRLNVVRIELPPLRERREDIPLLVEYMLRHFNYRFKKEVRGIAPDVMQLFLAYPWHGNVRELENCLEWAFIVCHDTLIQRSHIPREIVGFHEDAFTRAGCDSKASGRAKLSREAVEAALRKTDWNVAKSARLLGVARNTLYLRIREYALKRG